MISALICLLSLSIADSCLIMQRMSKSLIQLGVATAAVAVSALVFYRYKRGKSVSAISGTAAVEPTPVLTGLEDQNDLFTVNTSSPESLRIGLYSVCRRLFFKHCQPSLATQAAVPDNFTVIVVQGGLTNQVLILFLHFHADLRCSQLCPFSLCSCIVVRLGASMRCWCVCTVPKPKK